MGGSKDILDESDLSLPVQEVASTFGQYIKFFVTLSSENLTPADLPRNAADVLMQSSMALTRPEVPS